MLKEYMKLSLGIGLGLGKGGKRLHSGLPYTAYNTRLTDPPSP